MAVRASSGLGEGTTEGKAGWLVVLTWTSVAATAHSASAPAADEGGELDSYGAARYGCAIGRNGSHRISPKTVQGDDFVYGKVTWGV